MTELDPAPERAPTSEPPAPPRRPSARKSAVAIALLWGYGFLVAILAALPLLGVVRVLYGGHPAGDAPLAEPGGLALADLLLGRGAAPVAAALPASATLLVLGALLGHLPFGALLAHLERQGKGTLGLAYRRAFAGFFPLVGVTVLSLLVQGLAVLTGLFANEALGAALAGKVDARAADLLAGAALVPFGLALLVVHTATDLAYAHLFVRPVSLFRASVEALRTLRRERAASLVPALLAYAGGAGAQLAATGLVGLLGPSQAPLRMLLAHQGALLAKTIFRAVWLARAIELARDPSPATDVDGGHEGEHDELAPRSEPQRDQAALEADAAARTAER